MSETTLELPPDTTLPPSAPAAEAPTEMPQRSPREEAMLRIVERREEARAAELAFGETVAAEARQAAAEDPEEVARREEEATEAARKALETTPPPAPPAAPPSEPAPEIIEIEGMRFTREQAAQLARDGLIARKAINEYQQTVRQQPPAPAPAPAPRPVPRPILADEEAEALANDLVYGDKAANVRSIQRMAETIVSRVPQQIDPNAIIHAAVQQSQIQRTFEQNLQAIGNEFPDIFNNSKRSQLAALTLGEIRQRNAALGVQKPDLELYREACKTVRDELGLAAPTPQPAPAAQPAPQAAQPLTRLERKRAAPTIPQAADRRANDAPVQRYPTNSEYVEQMRRQRGLAPMR